MQIQTLLLATLAASFPSSFSVYAQSTNDSAAQSGYKTTICAPASVTISGTPYSAHVHAVATIVPGSNATLHVPAVVKIDGAKQTVEASLPVVNGHVQTLGGGKHGGHGKNGTHGTDMPHKTQPDAKAETPKSDSTSDAARTSMVLTSLLVAGWALVA